MGTKQSARDPLDGLDIACKIHQAFSLVVCDVNLENNDKVKDYSRLD